MPPAKARRPALISVRSSPMKLAIERMLVKPLADTPLSCSSTRPETGSKILIIKAPPAFAVQVQDSGRKPDSMIWQSSAFGIMRFILEIGLGGACRVQRRPVISSARAEARRSFERL